MANDQVFPARRRALQCMAFGGLGTLFTLAGGVLVPIELSAAADDSALIRDRARAAKPLFVQISDSHIGFSKAANPDVTATLRRTIQLVNELPVLPALVIHTGDITHLSKPAQFDLAQQLLSGLRTNELHTVPGEHDVADASVSEYFSRFGKASDNRGYYSFDHAGVHFVALTNVLNFKPGGLGALGPDQLAWVKADLASRSASTPIVVFAHMPLWTIYEPWGWGTADSGELMGELRRFGSVTVLNGHIHQIVQKVEGHITFHTANSTAYPQPAAGIGPGPGPLTVPAERLAHVLGMTSVAVVEHPRALLLKDATLAGNTSIAQGIAPRGRAGDSRRARICCRKGNLVRDRDEELHVRADDPDRRCRLERDVDQPGRRAAHGHERCRVVPFGRSRYVRALFVQIRAAWDLSLRLLYPPSHDWYGSRDWPKHEWMRSATDSSRKCFRISMRRTASRAGCRARRRKWTTSCRRRCCARFGHSRHCGVRTRNPGSWRSSRTAMQPPCGGAGGASSCRCPTMAMPRRPTP